MTATLRELLREIEALDDNDRVELDRALARRLETQWKDEATKARRQARRRKIDQTMIDRAIERRRYHV